MRDLEIKPMTNTAFLVKVYSSNITNELKNNRELLFAAELETNEESNLELKITNNRSGDSVEIEARDLLMLK
jgi:hypothetical protein